MIRQWLSILLLVGFLPLVGLCDSDGWDSEGDVSTSWGNIHYRTAGSGPPLLLLHGYFGQGGQWQKYREAFSADFQIIAIDLPGHGQSSHLTDGYDTRQAAIAMWELLDHLGHRKISAIGYSAGGMTLLEMAVQQPDRVHAAILAASAHQVVGTLDRGGWEDLPPAFQADMLRNHPGGVPQVKKLMASHHIPAIDLKRLSQISVPVLFVVGDRDESFPLATVLQTYQAMQHSELWVFPGLGHELFWSEWGGSKVLEKEFPEKARAFISER